MAQKEAAGKPVKLIGGAAKAKLLVGMALQFQKARRSRIKEVETSKIMRLCGYSAASA